MSISLKHSHKGHIGVVTAVEHLILLRYERDIGCYIEDAYGRVDFRLSDFTVLANLKPDVTGQMMIDEMVRQAKCLMELERLDAWFHEGDIPPSPPFEHYPAPQLKKLGGLSKMKRFKL